MPQAYEESFAQTVWNFLPGIIKTLSVISLIIIGFISVNIFSGNDSYAFEPDLVRDYNTFVGPADARVKVVYFVDYQCPACAGNNATMKQIKPKFQDRIQFVYKHYPIAALHVNAESAGAAVEAAGLQGKYFEYGDRVFESQDLGLTNSNLEDIARQLGLDITKFNQDRRSSQMQQRVSWDRRDMNTISLPNSSRSNEPKPAGDEVGTPTTVVFRDGEAIDWWTGGSTVEQLEAQLNGYLQN